MPAANVPAAGRRPGGSVSRQPAGCRSAPQVDQQRQRPAGQVGAGAAGGQLRQVRQVGQLAEHDPGRLREVVAGHRADAGGRAAGQRELRGGTVACRPLRDCRRRRASAIVRADRGAADDPVCRRRGPRPGPGRRPRPARASSITTRRAGAVRRLQPAAQASPRRAPGAGPRSRAHRPECAAPARPDALEPVDVERLARPDGHRAARPGAMSRT